LLYFVRNDDNGLLQTALRGWLSCAG
jgi:hypothetical protein